jgi:hypothetical protein
MAKQYLFFKLCPETVNYVRADLLLEKELSVYFKSLNRVETVFELNRFQEIRQLIEKDTDLQRYITHALPDAGIQGFLAILENPPPLEKLVKLLSFCDEFILFQRSHELKHTYIRYLSGINLAKQLQVYNWHIFVIPTLRSFVSSLPGNLKNITNLEKIDKIFQKPEQIFCRSVNSHTDPLHTSPNILEPLNSHSSRLTAALSNILISNRTHFTDLSMTSPYWAKHASTLGIPVVGYTKSLLQDIDNRLRTQLMTLDISVVQTAVRKFIILLGQLLDEPKYRQSHLFHSDMDHSFKLYEAGILLQHNYIKSYKKHLKLFRTIITARFLIDRKYITHDNFINLFLSFNLLQSIYLNLHGKFPSLFSLMIEKNAEKLIAEMYICQKTRELFSLKPTISNLISSEKYKSEKSGQRRAFFIRLPENYLNHDEKVKNHTKIALDLFQFDAQTQTDIKPDNYVKNDFTTKIRANRYLYNKIDFYRSFLPREEYFFLTNQCYQLFYSLDSILELFQPGDRIGFLSPIKYHYVDDSPHELSFPEIILEYLNVHTSFNYQTEFRLHIDTGNQFLHHEMVIISAI